MLDTEKYPNIARLLGEPKTNGGVKTKKHRPYSIRLLDWSRTFKWMLDIECLDALDNETKLKIKNILEQTVLPYLEELRKRI
jgi:hypothetical protein